MNNEELSKMPDLKESELEDNEILIPFADMVQQLVDYGEPLFLLSNE
ncbi:MAG: hypothetical protein F6K23_27700 [Okeania sp. SIO2C9]|nr:hypothetical protein [Okeania sp. SIO2C9]NEQ76486.1 hypothetical protein [Okeania sp. SIO2C9]